MATWYDIKLRAIQKMFSHKGNTIPNDASNVDYIAAMPGACNEALQLLATAGKFIIKSIEIAHNPVRNLIPDGKRILSSEGGLLSIEASGARALYVEVLGNVTMKVKINGFESITDVISSKTHYSEVRKLIASESTDSVVVEFSSDYPFAIKNFALYAATFETESDVQSFAEVIKYDLSQLADSFYMLADDPIIFEGEERTSRYMQTSSYFEEGGRVLVLKRDVPGNYRIYYRAYPQKITSSTPDDYELVLDPDVEALIPLYIASQLYKEDDNSLATGYRNEFETGFERLINAPKAPMSEHFTSESGWI